MHAFSLIVVLCLSFQEPAEPPWIELTGANDLAAWGPVTGDWEVVGFVGLDPTNPKLLKATPGKGIIYNGPKGRTLNLQTVEEFGDVEIAMEFMIPEKSNAGVKLNSHYEIQILDSYGKANPLGSDCGGIYPQAELLPKYHYLSAGYPPKVNAAKPAGELQSLYIRFRAPRFDPNDPKKKIKDARFELVLLNGQVVQKDQDVPSPTGHAHRSQEKAKGKILLQADHGPVAFRNIKVRPLPPLGEPAR